MNAIGTYCKTSFLAIIRRRIVWFTQFYACDDGKSNTSYGWMSQI